VQGGNFSSFEINVFFFQMQALLESGHCNVLKTWTCWRSNLTTKEKSSIFLIITQEKKISLKIINFSPTKKEEEEGGDFLQICCMLKLKPIVIF
jgi:hypothetical protein